MQFIPLYREYLKRHNFKNTVVFHNKKTTVFLKSNKLFSNQWRILSISWREQERHPGFYEINYSNVVHNGIDGRNLLQEIYASDTWYWDEYEFKLLRLLSDVRKDGFYAPSDRESILSAWEIFLIMCDSWIAHNANLDLIKSIEKTINKNLKIDDRLKEQKKAQELMMRLQNSRVNNLWIFQIQPLLKNLNSQWLVDLINEQ